MIRRWASSTAIAGSASALALILPAGALAQLPELPPEPQAPPPEEAKLEVRIDGDRKGRVTAGDEAKVVGTLRPFEPGQKVDVIFSRADHTLKHQTVEVHQAKGGDHGEFQLRTPRLIEPGTYHAKAVYAGNDHIGGTSAETKNVGIRYPHLSKGDRGPEVNLFNDLLAKQGYATSHGKKYTQITGWAVLAFRKVHGMGRVQSATSGIFKTLAAGKGEFQVQFPNDGKHAEVDISRQVLVLADRDEPVRTYHVSTGAPGTPSDRGNFSFNRRQPGYNALRMYYTTYYNGGEGIHGYHSVPTHPASHGCIRVPIPQAREIYGWVQLGMGMHVYD